MHPHFHVIKFVQRAFDIIHPLEHLVLSITLSAFILMVCREECMYDEEEEGKGHTSVCSLDYLRRTLIYRVGR